MNKRITYLFGAGASYNACPIWKEQGEKMIALSKKVISKAEYIETERNQYKGDKEQLFWKMGFYGTKAMEFNTIDAFARKLYLNVSLDKLKELKTSVSLFFTIWQLSDKFQLISPEEIKQKRFKTNDHRYINLLASCLEKGNDRYTPKLNANIRFVTWNYDLQLELAYKLFCEDISCDEIDKTLQFIPEVNNPTKNLSVCHLNGFHGFYNNRTGGYNNIMDRHNDSSIENIIENIEFVGTSVDRNQIDFSPYINYAWENDDNKDSSHLSKIAREQAKKIFSETDILVIIGYSFPSFNREIDKSLFNACIKNIKKIIYQDPNGNADYLSEAFDINRNIIESIKENNDQFILPSLF